MDVLRDLSSSNSSFMHNDYGIRRKICGLFLLCLAVREGELECVGKEVQREETVGKLGCLTEVLSLDSNRWALAIQTLSAPTGLLVLLTRIKLLPAWI